VLPEAAQTAVALPSPEAPGSGTPADGSATVAVAENGSLADSERATPPKPNCSSAVVPIPVSSTESRSRATCAPIEASPKSSTTIPAAVGIKSTPGVVDLLKRHPKTRDIDLTKTLTIEQRCKIVSVCVSKLVESESLYPNTASKLNLADRLQDVTGIPASAFFDSTSHRGYINKYLENIRAKSSPSKRKYSWSKPASASSKRKQSSSTREDASTTDLPEGCPRGKIGCCLCKGRQFNCQLLSFLFVGEATLECCSMCKKEVKR